MMGFNTLAEGTFLKHNEYRIIAVLGQGGFGITYLAEQLSLSRTVAIKEFFMKESCNRDPQSSEVSVPSTGSRESVWRFKEKFLREARMIAKLDHPLVVKIHDVFEEKGTAYYVMEYLEGGSLNDLIKREGALSVSRALGYIDQVGHALAHLHARNILHFDVKPSNILIGESGQAVLIDFGISKHYDEGGSQTSSTPVGISKGYAPLEQYQQSEVSTFTPATDIYALGATLYCLLTGRIPPSASEVNEEGLPELPVTIPVPVRNAIVKAMSPRRKDRPQSVREFLALLKEQSAPDTNHVVTEETEIPSQTVPPSSEEDTEVSPKTASPSSAPAKSKRLSTGARVGIVLTIVLSVLGWCISVFVLYFPPNRIFSYFSSVIDITDEREEVLEVADTVVVDSTVCMDVSGVVAERVVEPEVVVPGSLKVISTPSGADIWLDGKNTGRKTPELFEDMTPGRHTVMLKLTDYNNVSRKVSVKSSERSECVLELQAQDWPAPEAVVPVTGELRITSIPSGAAILLDGKVTGKTTPQVFNPVAVGQHTVQLHLEGYGDVSKEVEVSAYERTDCALSLPSDGSVTLANGWRKLKNGNKTTYTNGNVSFTMVAVAGGTFTMGGTDEQGIDIQSEEKPTHKVTLSGFLIGETEVTQSLWKAVMGNNPSYFMGDHRPVESVSYHDCLAFISKLNALTGEYFRLPTEAQWEFAARGGNYSRGHKYSGGHIDNVAWYVGNSTGSHSVKTRKPNELGLYDMSGNVSEWCRDWFGDYASYAQTNPQGAGFGSSRVIRGGAWNSSPQSNRVTSRNAARPGVLNARVGFRLVLN